MKRTFTLLFILITINSFAQPSLLSSEMASPGTVFTYKHVGTFTPIDTAVQGANQTWNFSTVTTTTDPDYVNTIINPALTAYHDSFPTANWGLLEDGDTTFNFFHLSSTNMERVGGYNPTDGYTYYPNTQIEYVFPMQLGVSNVDVSTNVNNGSSTNVNYAFDCIGYGTLIAPGGHTYTNVIMTRVVVDIVFLQVVSFIWYDSDNGMPVFNYIPGDGFFIPEAAIYLNSVTTVGINENSFASGLRINNPVSNMLFLSLYSETPVALSYDLRNSLGQILTSGIIEKSQFPQLHLEMTSNAGGLYFLTVRDLSDPSKSKSVKVIKQ
jgi:hypothetical protein